MPLCPEAVDVLFQAVRATSGGLFVVVVLVEQSVGPRREKI